MAKKITQQDILQRLKKRNTEFPVVAPVGNWKYENIHQSIEWVCSNNHNWNAPIIRILQGKGCPVCSRTKVGNNNKKSVTDLALLIEYRNSVFPDKPVSLKDPTNYAGMTKKCSWVCAEGHEWEAIPKTVVKGSYCPECRRIKNIERQTDTHESALHKLKIRNSLFPNKKVYLHANETYKSNKTPLTFVCDRGHVWKGLMDYVLNGNAGCPICAKSGHSHKALDWLTQVSVSENITIQHAQSPEGEFRIPGTRYKVDGFCADTKTVYEFYGDYWHGNPKLFSPTDMNEVNKMTFGQLYQRTINREQKIHNMGYNIISIWEHDWDTRTFIHTTFQSTIKQALSSLSGVEYNIKKDNDMFDVFIPSCGVGIKLWLLNSKNMNRYEQISVSSRHPFRVIHVFEDEWLTNKDLILNKITHYLGVNTSSKRIHARLCTIRELDKKTKSLFLKQFHVQGNDNSQVIVGAFHQDELVAVMTFTQPRVALGYKNKDRNTYEGMWELSRFATNTSMRIPGIASKLLTYFQRNYEWKKIVSYADARWSVGTLYDTLGFVLETHNPPNYWYVINGSRKHRWNYRKDKIKETLPNYDQNLTEYQNMVNAGFWRVWDCGTLRYVLNNS